MSSVFSLRLPNDLRAALHQHARMRGIPPAEAARDLLRRAIGVVSTSYDAGYAEGRLAGYKDQMRKMNGAA